VVRIQTYRKIDREVGERGLVFRGKAYIGQPETHAQKISISV